MSDVTLTTQARAVGNAVFIETVGGCGDIAAWGASSGVQARIIADAVNRAIKKAVTDEWERCLAIAEGYTGENDSIGGWSAKVSIVELIRSVDSVK